MSHDIDESTGKPAMAYVGEVPWHGLGQALPPGQDIDIWVKAAGLDWDIEMLPVRYQMNDQSYVMSDRFVLARSDTQAALSVVSGDYQAVQPKAVLEFYRDLVEQRGYPLETAGALAGGRKAWAQGVGPGAHGAGGGCGGGRRRQVGRLCAAGHIVRQNVGNDRHLHVGARGVSKHIEFCRARHENSAWFGTGAVLKEKAWEKALEMTQSQ